MKIEIRTGPKLSIKAESEQDHLVLELLQYHSLHKTSISSYNSRVTELEFAFIEPETNPKPIIHDGDNEGDCPKTAPIARLPDNAPGGNPDNQNSDSAGL